MNAEEIKALLEAGLADAEAQVESDGRHVSAVIVSPVFEGLRPVQRQQLVYKVVNEQIASGAIHALNMKTLTPAEAESAQS